MAIRPKLTLEDYGGDQAKLDLGNAALEAAWNRANPAGTLVANAVQPNITPEDVGGIKNWGEQDRVIRNAYLRANGEGDDAKGINEQVAAGIANGTLTGKDAVNNYAALAAGKLDELQGQGPFQYDFNKDALFKTLSDSYMQQAKQAAANVQASAAARTGGYGNSYGAAAAGQQYNAALGNLYDQIPALQDAAYERYLNERNDLYKQAGYYNDREAEAYDRTQDELAQQNYQNERAFEQAQYAASLGNYDPAEKLLGVDFSAAQTADDINMLSTLSATLGYDQALAVMTALKQQNQSGDAGSEGGNTGEQPAEEKPAVTLSDAATGQHPEVSAGTARWGTQTVLLPPAKTENGTYTYEYKYGQLRYTFTDNSGKRFQGTYTGPLVSPDGTVVQQGTGDSMIPYPLLGKDGSSPAGNVPAKTGNPLIDALNGLKANDAVAQAAMEANGITGDDLAMYRMYSNLADDWYAFADDDGYGSYSGSGSGSGRGGSGRGSGGGTGGYTGGSTPTPAQPKADQTPKNTGKPVTQVIDVTEDEILKAIYGR